MKYIQRKIKEAIQPGDGRANLSKNPKKDDDDDDDHWSEIEIFYSVSSPLFVVLLVFLGNKQNEKAPWSTSFKTTKFLFDSN